MFKQRGGGLENFSLGGGGLIFRGGGAKCLGGAEPLLHTMCLKIDLLFTVSFIWFDELVSEQF